MRDEHVTVYWSLTGLVQGVGFRWYISRHARALELAGWVRNTGTGEVLILARGSAESVARLRDLVLEGPSGSRVDEVREVEEPPESPPAVPFSIVS